MKQRIIIIVVSIIITIASVVFVIYKKTIEPDIYSFNVIERYAPKLSYDITINTNTRYIKAKEITDCSDSECGTEKNTVLTRSIYRKIVKIINKNPSDEIIRKFAIALYTIAGEEEILNENYDRQNDLNKDGKVTNKELGTKLINDILKEI